MYQYHQLLRRVLIHGEMKPTRAILESTGKNVSARSLFGAQIAFQLQCGFPLMTTKFVPFSLVAHELIWFLSGDTNIRYLHDNGVRIWDQWADSNGELGPVYGKQWRSWGTSTGKSIDQIRKLVDGIESVKKDPTASVGRRLIVTAWNPEDVDHMALPPCHTLFQFSVTEDRLSCHLYMRSADLFLGVPFNIASYALLTHLVAHVTQLIPDRLVISFGDAHIYENHFDQLAELLSREPRGLPNLSIASHLTDLTNIERSQLILSGYNHHGVLKGEVAV